MQEKQSHCHLENATTALRFFCEKIYFIEHLIGVIDSSL
jgi:hypothetical protein